MQECRNKKGRVAVFVRKDIDQRDTFEHITVKLSERQSSQLLVHIIYRPPNPSKSKFIEEFTCFMEAAALSPHKNIVLGEDNIQLDSQNCWTDNFNTVLSDFDFIQHVSTSTHIQGHILGCFFHHNFSGQKFLQGKMLKTQKREGVITECIVIKIITKKIHTNWLMPIGARECNLNIQVNSIRLRLEVLDASNLGVHHSSTENCMFLWLCPSLVK